MATEETQITYDYEIKEVRVYSDREGVINRILRRLGSQDGVRHEGKFLFIPMVICRDAWAIAKLLNPDEKQPMTEEMKAKLRGDE